MLWCGSIKFPHLFIWRIDLALILNLDLDGVMADFDKHFHDTFGVYCHHLDDKSLWSKINSYDSFFFDLPIMDGALDFFNYVTTRTEVRILTACPKTNYAHTARQKVAWVRKNISANVQVIPMLGGVNKVLFMQNSGDILIDDFEKNINSWTDGGGVGILHKNFDQTKKELGTQFPVTFIKYWSGMQVKNNPTGNMEKA